MNQSIVIKKVLYSLLNYIKLVINLERALLNLVG